MDEGYEIRECGYHAMCPNVRITVDYLQVLPLVLRRLCELGYDLSEALETLQSAVEKQRKRKALDAAISDLTKPTAKA